MTVDLTIPFQFSRLPMLPAEDSLSYLVSAFSLEWGRGMGLPVEPRERMPLKFCLPEAPAPVYSLDFTNRGGRRSHLPVFPGEPRVLINICIMLCRFDDLEKWGRKTNKTSFPFLDYGIHPYLTENL